MDSPQIRSKPSVRSPVKQIVTFPFLNSMWRPSAYLMVTTLGLINLIASYFFLVETKGINLDAVKIHEEDVEEDEKMDMVKKENGSA
uniref:Ovule protein n=1 Tax=Steinernema glaseri TaxID=37863 RepID=A0A1I7YLY0_9BILA